uniref:(northern house mosquito) hypothetical protein n=1 Tax=Culex pipiens TaxID=7175 RepID=A0A8D8EZV4_CULPI
MILLDTVQELDRIDHFFIQIFFGNTAFFGVFLVDRMHFFSSTFVLLALLLTFLPLIVFAFLPAHDFEVVPLFAITALAALCRTLRNALVVLVSTIRADLRLLLEHFIHSVLFFHPLILLQLLPRRLFRHALINHLRRRELWLVDERFF